MPTYGSEIPLKNIRSFYDAGNPRSYMSGDTQWIDLIGGNTMTLSASAASDTYHSIEFLVGGGAVEDVGINRQGGEHTIIVFSRRTSPDTNGRVLQAKSGNWLLGHWSTYDDQYYAQGWVADTRVSTPGNTWKMYTGLGDNGSDKWSFWVNDVIQVDESAGGSQGPNGLAINGLGGFNEPCDCEVGLILDYSRWLSPTEIRQVYTSFKTRYDIQ